MAICKHCKCGIDNRRKCDTCERIMSDQCKTCHEEVAHGQIRVQNIHICGNGNGSWLNSVENDPDAYGKAD